MDIIALDKLYMVSGRIICARLPHVSVRMAADAH